MGLVELFLLAVGLSMDAFAVSVCKGLSTQKLKWKHYLTIGLWFGGFQALMPTIGYFLGSTFEAYITSVDHWVAFVLLSLIGGNMLREGLISEIQEIRASERRFYQKITDIYATAVDYSLDSQTTKDFFATVQNKMHYAVHGGTAAEVIMARADHTKEHMGLTSWKNAPDGKIVKADVSIAKNYLSMGEMQELNEIVTMYLDYATRQARRHIPMTMADWASKLDAFLQFNDAEILQNKGKVTAAIAKAFAESEFEQYRVIQDHLYQSDFDRLVASTEQKN